MLSALTRTADPAKQRIRLVAIFVGTVVAGYLACRALRSVFGCGTSSTTAAAAPKPIPRRLQPLPANLVTTGITITDIRIHPIKSCGSGIQLKEALLTPTGFKWDREWVIIRADGSRKIVTQRETPQLKLISPEISADEKELIIKTPKSVTSLRIAPSVQDMLKQKDFRVYAVSLWGIEGEVVDEGDAIADFLTNFLNIPVRLCRVCTHRRPSTSVKHKPITQQSDVVSLHDFSSLHVISEEGLEYVRQLGEKKVREAAAAAAANSTTDAAVVKPTPVLSDPIDASRFRPNIVVRGAPFPQEDAWLNFRIVSSGGDNSSDGIHVRVSKHTGRCSIPTILCDASRDPAYFPTGALKETRNAYYTHQERFSIEGRQKWPQFGLNVTHKPEDSGKIVRVGDQIVVEEFQPQDNLLDFN